MCGRYVVTKELSDLREFFDAETPIEFSTISYNIAPTQVGPILVEREVDSVPTRELHPARFGLIPQWAKEVQTPLFNARIETVLEKPSFKDSALRKRCVVPASGYFEWDSEKQPHYVFADPLIFFAGIYSFWRDPAKQATDPSRWVLSFSILTKPASPSLSWVHERSPVFLSEDGVEAWIAPDYETTPDLLSAIGAESDEVAQFLQHHAVSKAVGKVSENSVELISPITF
jgi:putative SOS response-associated peptidase YedK